MQLALEQLLPQVDGHLPEVGLGDSCSSPGGGPSPFSPARGHQRGQRLPVTALSSTSSSSNNYIGSPCSHTRTTAAPPPGAVSLPSPMRGGGNIYKNGWIGFGPGVDADAGITSSLSARGTGAPTTHTEVFGVQPPDELLAMGQKRPRQARRPIQPVTGTRTASLPLHLGGGQQHATGVGGPPLISPPVRSVSSSDDVFAL
ncbi:unnamed protein product, partial [Amoebophrya sp. A25]